MGHSWMIKESKFVDVCWAMFSRLVSAKTTDRVKII